jgi:hypothetical protein
MSQRRLPGPEMFIMKLAFANHWSATMDTALEVLGADSMLAGDDAPEQGAWLQWFLSQYAIRLGGGTDEVQHNIIGERGLGLPREPSTDRDVPWKDLMRA